MKTTSIYPVLLVSDVGAAADWFERWFDFERTFAADWYVSLRHDRWELAILDQDHETIPAIARGTGAAGLLVNIECDDVDAVHERLVVAGGLEVLLPLRSEAFGQRHFIVAGPEGVLVDVITEIAPTEEFADAFTA